MNLRARVVLAAFLFAITLVGVAAGVKLAQLEQRAKIAAALKSEQLAEENLAKTGAPALKADDSFIVKESSKPASKPVEKPVAVVDPDGISAEAYIVGDIETGKVYFEKKADRILPFASMSKLITALVATHIYESSSTITITPEEMNVPADASGLKAGESFTVTELLYPLLLNSSNVAGEALASSTNRTSFLKVMSDYSWELGMPESVLADPTGLSENNSGTARGFFGMARYLYRERPDILEITRTATTSVATTTDHGAHMFSSIHPFVSDPRFIGGKTGHTPAALDTMLTIFRIDSKTIALIVLRSDNRARDTALLVEKYKKIGS